jgi:glycosyltransferase involved in cell wall biosynthesis
VVFDLAHAHALPLVISLHGSDVFLAERSLPARLLAVGALRQAGAVSACSGDLRARALALGAPPGRTRTVPYGVDADLFRPGAAGAGVRERYGIPASAFLILGVGRLVEKKGFRVLIDAVAMLPGAHVLLAGDGSLRDELRRHAEALQAPVTFAGALAHDALPEAFAAADVVAVPSVVDRAGNVDGLPNALLEALASGRAVVASAVAGIPDVVSDGRNGLLVKSGDAAALASALRRLKDDAETRGALAAAARRSAERELTWARAAQAFEELFAEASSLDAR